MSRVSDYNEQFLYTKTNPENIIESPANGWFFRKGNDFWLNTSGDLYGTWIKLPYKTVILPRPPDNKLILFEQEMELWIKNSDGFIDEYEVVHPKTDWKFYAYDIDVFLEKQETRVFSWIFPAPTNTNDPVGINGDRSLDENYFYAKTGGLWYRTPIAIFGNGEADTGEVPYWYSNLPFVDAPRKTPPPATINDGGLYGEQSYDSEFFYIRVSSWKRAPLVYFNPSKMTIF
jgi:hypothetical protein